MTTVLGTLVVSHRLGGEVVAGAVAEIEAGAGEGVDALVGVGSGEGVDALVGVGSGDYLTLI